MTEVAARRSTAGVIAETLQDAALLAWVGGHAALGAFAARIVFRDLPRSLAAPTMTTVFRSFDGLIVGAVGLLFVATLVRGFAFGLGRAVDQIVAAAGALLCAVGLFELGYVHPGIERLFESGRTLEPAFASLHRLSERCGHLEVILACALFAGQAFSRRR